MSDHQTDAEAVRASVAKGYDAIARGAGSDVQAELSLPGAQANPSADAAARGDGTDRAASSGCCAPASDATPANSTLADQAATAGAGGCCGPTLAVDDLARALGYDPTELAGLPGGANLGLSCGNPAAIASLAPGEVVLDLGSGAGFDVFLAGPRVGAQGRVIGVDMTPSMLDRARRNAAEYRQRTGLDNVEFRLGEIEHLPVADASVDVVISNCVLNLSPDKERVWAEVARILKPGGRVAISDLGLLEPLPDGAADHLEALIGCVAGAELVATTEDHIEAAGLDLLRLECRSAYVDSLVGANDPLYAQLRESLPRGRRITDFVTSVSIVACRPHLQAAGDRLAASD